MKIPILLIGILLVSGSSYGEVDGKAKLSVYAFEVTGSETVEAYRDKIRGDGPYLEKDELQELLHDAKRFEMIDLEFTNDVRLAIQDVYCAQHLSREGNQYVLKRSSTKVGLSCDLVIGPMEPGGFHVEGSMSYLAVADRKKIETLSRVDAGIPIRVMGGRFDHGLLLPPGKIATIIAAFDPVQGDEPRMTGLVFSIDRDLSVEDSGAVTHIVL